MDGVIRLANGRHRLKGTWPALAVIAVLIAAGCSAQGASKAGGAPETVTHGTITLTFASADPLPVDTAFQTLVAKDSGGHLRLRAVYYNARSTTVDQTIAEALRKGKLDVGDVGSRAWESLGVQAFRAYQDPFLVTSRPLLDRAVTGTIAAGLLAALRPAKVAGLAIVPASIRYLFSTRPLTTPAQFRGAKIRINESDTTSEIMLNLGATPVTDIAGGPPAVQALRSGALTAIESDPVNAVLNGYVHAAPYVVVNEPIFAKTTTIAASSAVLARLPAADARWLLAAARQAALGARQANGAADHVDWATMCGQGLRALAVTQQQFGALHDAEAATYADLASDEQTALAVDRIGGLAAAEPRTDTWATCHGVGLGASPTALLDGTYSQTVTEAEVVATGQCTDCGNAGSYRLVILDGRYALYHPVQVDASPSEPSVADQSAWKPTDPVEVGTVAVAGNRLIQVPETSQQNGSVPTVYRFDLFRGLLTLRTVSGNGWFTAAPWRRLT
jgi:TRAP-type C4-dicarboxylate transport system substrate-binding protein